MHIKLRYYTFTLVLIAAIWVLCLMPIPETPLSNVSMIDKWTHLVMYGGTFSIMWLEWARHNSKQGLRLTDKFFKARTMLLGWLAPVLMSGFIELLQAYCTGGRRSGEWLDFAANSIGVTLALFIGFVITQIKR